jgi:hypothetical protein
MGAVNAEAIAATPKRGGPFVGRWCGVSMRGGVSSR